MDDPLRRYLLAHPECLVDLERQLGLREPFLSFLSKHDLLDEMLRIKKKAPSPAGSPTAD